MRICPVSKSTKWEVLYESFNNKIMTGDQRIGDGRLKKIICKESGVVANKDPFSEQELEVIYGKEYELNTLGQEEHFFFTKEGKKARSQVFFDWIKPFLNDDFNSLVEIGCGEGNLLQKVQNNYTGKNIIGFDGSKRAVKLAKKKGLNVHQKLILGDQDLPKSDVYLLINVIEHIEDINSFITKIKQSLSENGKIIFCLPIQDFGGYDIFFAEHVWHFTVDHFKQILKNNGLKLIASDINHPINHGIGLFVCKSTEKEEQNNLKYTGVIKDNFNYWINKFKKLNSFLERNTFNSIAVFGGSEVFTLFITFTLLKQHNLIACIDDTKAGTVKHEIPIFDSKWLINNKPDIVFISTNKKYHPAIEEKLKTLNINSRPIY